MFSSRILQFRSYKLKSTERKKNNAISPSIIIIKNKWSPWSCPLTCPPRWPWSRGTCGRSRSRSVPPRTRPRCSRCCRSPLGGDGGPWSGCSCRSFCRAGADFVFAFLLLLGNQVFFSMCDRLRRSRMTTDWEKCLFRMKGGGRERRINNLRSAVNPPVSLLRTKGERSIWVGPGGEETDFPFTSFFFPNLRRRRFPFVPN